MSEAWLDDAQVWLEFTSLTCVPSSLYGSVD
jgi:hypothetical protein